MLYFSFSELGEIATLKTLQVFGIVTANSLQLLKATLPHIKFNTSYFTPIARPTTGCKKNQEIWGIQCRLNLRNPAGVWKNLKDSDFYQQQRWVPQVFTVEFLHSVVTSQFAVTDRVLSVYDQMLSSILQFVFFYVLCSTTFTEACPRNANHAQIVAMQYAHSPCGNIFFLKKVALVNKTCPNVHILCFIHASYCCRVYLGWYT